MNKVYIYCPRKSDGAFELVRGLGAKRLRRFDGLEFWNKGKRFAPEAGSAIICWGTPLPELDGVRVVNALEKSLNKLQEATTLTGAGVPTITVGAHDPRRISYDKYVKAGYLPRQFQHVGGNDLLNMDKNRVDYWSKQETFLEEYRIHSFDGRSIRAGKKVHRDGFKLVEAADFKPNVGLVHPWIRSFDGGWRIVYDGFKSTSDMRNAAHAAVKALGLTFGAVDVAKRMNGTFCVLEVNSAPGLEGNTTTAYVKAFERLLKPKEVPNEV